MSRHKNHKTAHDVESDKQSVCLQLRPFGLDIISDSFLGVHCSVQYTTLSNKFGILKFTLSV